MDATTASGNSALTATGTSLSSFQLADHTPIGF